MELSDTNDDVIPAVDHFLDVQDISVYKERICLLCGLSLCKCILKNKCARFSEINCLPKADSGPRLIIQHF